MFTVVVPRDVSSEEVAEALRDGLGGGYNVLPGMHMSRNPLGNPYPSHPDTILVGTGTNKFIRAQVTITRCGGESRLRINPGGISSELLINTLGLARKLRRVLSEAPRLH